MPAGRAWLVAAVLAVQPALGAGAWAAVAQPSAATARSAADSAGQDLSPEAQASAKAAETGAPVDVPADTTPTQTVSAQPDGTFVLNTAVVPERAKVGSDWVPIDTTLQSAPGGTISPKAATSKITFSGGGSSAPLATISRDGVSYSIKSPWTLPAPTLSGADATYASVLPDVDLVVTALPDGFSENLVVKTRQAALDPDLATVRFPVETSGVTLTSQTDGGVALVDGSGRPQFTTGTALMWDSTPASTTDPAATPDTASRSTASGEAAAAQTAATSADTTPADAADGPGPGAKTAVMGVSATGDTLSVSPDRSFLSDPTTTYPVVLDPQTTSSSLAGWTALWSGQPSTSFWKTKHTLGSGYDSWADSKVVRSLYQFDTHSLSGKKILSATFTALEVWAANCTKQPVELWHTGGISSASTWKRQPSWMSRIDTVSAAKGYSSSCPGGNVSFDATSAVAYGAARSGATTTVGLRASSESNDLEWKQFASPATKKPTLSVTFVSKPSTPTSLKLSSPNLACGKSSSVAVNIRTLTPTLSASPKSADGSQSKLRPNFQLYRYDPDIPDPLVASGSPSSWTTSGKAGTWKTPTLQNGQTYWFKARTEYQYSFDGKSASMYSGWTTIGACAFHVDTSRPAPPTVTSTAYPECATADDPDSCSASGGVGAPATFTLDAGASDVVKYIYTLNQGRQVTKSFSSPTSSLALNLAPDVRGLNALTVQTADAAGNVSASYTYFFKVGAGAPPVDAWAFDEGSGGSAADSAGSHPATLSASGASWSKLARSGGALAVDGSSGYAAVSGTGLDTTKSFSISGWARLTDLSHNAVIAAQAGAHGSSFALYYSTAYKAWIFNRYTSDSTTPTIVRSVSTATPAMGVWTHLLGVYDAQAETIQLYVNGVPQGDPVSFTTPWKATGGLQIGRGQYGGSFTDYFTGQIDDVRLWNRIMSSDEVADLQDMTDAQGDARPTLAADWELGGTSGSTAQDTSGYGHTATLGSGASWTDDVDGGMGNALALDGTSNGYVSSAGPVVDSQGAFTIAAWAKLDSASLADTSVAHTVTIAGQSGGKRDSWSLWYSQPAGSTQGAWMFGRTTADSTTATVVSDPTGIGSAELADPTAWTLLTGVYDAAHQNLTLYVNGVAQGTVGDSASDEGSDGGVTFDKPWQATGTFSIGRGRTASGGYGDYATGLVQRVRVWTGVMSGPDIAQMYYDEYLFPL
ncbi:LamG-like jellyroll fold domain-containing protein [Streptomyces montanisoli]|uniref:LamG domain-containing protein n=1 Tax=Streptomyces montanisoli TaxID=2798581 RepID=A0A940MCT2_9ACTN|nr:LamG-like jellyroll fold domain-containing protein [Streptomyces montanisoli]MBP0458657.1 LamG domain-containing protein [Streptomyces montanisoli]